MINFFKEIIYDELGNISFLGHVFKSLLIIIISFILIKIIQKSLDRAITKATKTNVNLQKVKTFASVFKSFVTIFIFIFAIIAILDEFGVNTGSILAVAGVGGVAIAFASQSIVKDVINGAFILFENQFNLHDQVTIGDSTGQIIDIGLRTVKIKDISGAIHIIPNSSITKVTNHSVNNMRVYTELEVGTNKSVEDVEKIVEDTINQIYKEDDCAKIYLVKPEILSFDIINSFSYKIIIQSLAENGKQYAAQNKLKKYLLINLQKSGIYDDFIILGGKSDRKV